jgi:hypothetical protein
MTSVKAICGLTMFIVAGLFVYCEDVFAETNKAAVVKAGVIENEEGIGAYSQGKLVISGKTNTQDVLIMPDGTVNLSWDTKTTHVLTVKDIGALLDSKPEIIIVGTGHQSLLKPSPDLKKRLKGWGIEAEFLQTDKAVERFKELKKAGKQVGACFHIGC